jgi:pre-mRNA-processing factor 6
MNKNADIWLESIRFELKCDNEKIAHHLLARALQECPNSGRLWAQAVAMEPAASRMPKATDAVKHVKDDSNIFIAIGKIFWVEKKPVKARKFLNEAIRLDKDNGDAWLHLYHFEKENSFETVI